MDAGLQALRAGKPFAEIFAEVLALAAEELPSPAWDALAATDVGADVEKATGWLLRQLEERWPPDDLSALRFGLHPVRGPRPGRVELVVALSGGPGFPDPSWLANQTWDPVGYAPTQGLRSLLPLAAEASEDVRAVVREPLALVYVAALAAATLDAVDPSRILGDRPQLGVAAGFVDGELVLIGILTAGGLERTVERIAGPVPAEPGTDGAG